MNDLNDKRNTWPAEIWLQHGADELPDYAEVRGSELTWCADKINESDVRYVRATSAPQAAPSDGLQIAVTALRNAQQFLGKSREDCFSYDQSTWDHYQKGIDAILAAAPSSLAPAPQGAASDEDNDDAKYAVIVDRRDLFDTIRAAWGEGQSGGDCAGATDTAANWHSATDYADGVIKAWSTMRPAASLTQAATSEPVGYVFAGALDSLKTASPRGCVVTSVVTTITKAQHGEFNVPVYLAAPPAAQQAPSDEHAAELEAIGKKIGYGRACQILGELWDQMLEREYGRPSSRGKMERRRDIEEIEAFLKSCAALSAQQAGVQEAPSIDPVIARAYQRDHEKAVRAVELAAEYTPEIQGCVAPDNAIQCLAVLLSQARAAPSASSAVTNEDARIPALLQALRDIVDPIGTMQREVPEGSVLNGAMAITVANGPQWYKDRAQKALDADSALASQGVKGGEHG